MSKQWHLLLPLAMPTLAAPPEPATVVDVAPHLAHIASFAVHKHSLFSWRVSCIENGFCVPNCDAGTPEESIRRARKALAAKTAEQFVEIMAKAKKMEYVR